MASQFSCRGIHWKLHFLPGSVTWAATQGKPASLPSLCSYLPLVFTSSVTPSSTQVSLQWLDQHKRRCSALLAVMSVQTAVLSSLQPIWWISSPTDLLCQIAGRPASSSLTQAANLQSVLSKCMQKITLSCKKTVTRSAEFGNISWENIQTFAHMHASFSSGMSHIYCIVWKINRSKIRSG